MATQANALQGANPALSDVDTSLPRSQACAHSINAKAVVQCNAIPCLMAVGSHAQRQEGKLGSSFCPSY